MPFPTGEEENPDNVELMQMFLGGLDDLLGKILSEGLDSKGNPLFYDELLPQLRDGFDDMGKHFQILYNAITEIPEEQISNHALAGRQLSLKLGIVHFFAGRFERIGGVGPLRKVLDTLEGLLDSMIDAAVVGGAIKEFKDFVRNSTTD